MIDELTSNTSAPENQKEELPIATEIDPILGFVARIVRNTDIELGITLYVKGNIISGLAISPQKYFDGIAKEFESAKGSQEVSQAFAKGFRMYRDSVTSFNEESQGDKPDPVYINLKNAKFISGGIFNANNTGVYWRGRLDQIDGFSFGNI